MLKIITVSELLRFRKRISSTFSVHNSNYPLIEVFLFKIQQEKIWLVTERGILICFDAFQAIYLHEVQNPRWQFIEIVRIGVLMLMPNCDMVPLMKVPQNRVLQRNDKSVILCHNQPLNVQKVTNNMVIVKNTSPSTDRWPTVGQQSVNIWLTLN